MGADGADGGMDNGDGKGAEASGGTIFLFFYGAAILWARAL